MERRKMVRRVSAFFSLICIAANAWPVQAQRRPPAAPAAKAAPAKAGWSGVITYRKTMDDSFSSDEKLFGHIQESDRIKHNLTQKVTYSGRILVNDLAGTGRPQTRATVSYLETRSNKDIQTETTNCHSWEPDRLIKAESTDRQITRGNGEGEAESLSISVNGDRFSIGFTLPTVAGRYTHETSSKYSNLCPDSTRAPSAGTNEQDTRITGTGATVEGQVDPRAPDVLTGTKTWVSGTTSTSNGFTHVVTWRLTRKPQPLIITDLRFYEPTYPSPSDWREIGDKGHTTDGNQVKIVATIANLASTDKTANVNFKELKENTTLATGPVSATVPRNGQKDVELVWDTSGYAWKESGSEAVPEMDRQIEVTIPDDAMQKELTVVPKPVVIVWGFWQSAEAMTSFRNYFRAVNPKWGVWSSKTDNRKISTDNAGELDASVREIQQGENAWHVDLVSVTNGGLIGRVYVNSKMPTQFDGRPTAIHLVMASVPNLGTPCAVGLYGLSFKLNTFNLDAVAELSPDSMKRFNLLVNNTNGTKFASLAVRSRFPTCQEEVNGDGFTPVGSAVWRTKTKLISTQNVWVKEIMGDVTHFRQIMKWLAVPPKGDHNPDPATLAMNAPPSLDIFEDAFEKSRRYGAMFSTPAADDSGQKADFAQVVRIPASRTVEIPVPVRAGRTFSLQLLATADVNATLVNANGETLGQSLGDAGANEIFRSINLKRDFPAGTWTLRLENRSAQETELAVTAFVDYMPRD